MIDENGDLTMILTVFHVEWVDLSWACAALCSVAVLCVSKLFLRAFALKQWNRLEHLPPQVDKSIEVKYHLTLSPSATRARQMPSRYRTLFSSSWIVCACLRRDELSLRNGNAKGNGGENGSLIKKSLKGARHK